MLSSEHGIAKQHTTTRILQSRLFALCPVHCVNQSSARGLGACSFFFSWGKMRVALIVFLAGPGQALAE